MAHFNIKTLKVHKIKRKKEKFEIQVMCYYFYQKLENLQHFRTKLCLVAPRVHVTHEEEKKYYSDSNCLSILHIWY